MTIHFTVDQAGLDRLLSAPEADRALTNRAEDVAREWQRLDPRSRPGGHEPPTIAVGRPHQGHGASVVDVTTPDPIWHIIEFGSVQNPPYRPAERAALVAGLEFEKAR